MFSCFVRKCYKTSNLRPLNTFCSILNNRVKNHQNFDKNKNICITIAWSRKLIILKEKDIQQLSVSFEIPSWLLPSDHDSRQIFWDKNNHICIEHSIVFTEYYVILSLNLSGGDRTLNRYVSGEFCISLVFPERTSAGLGHFYCRVRTLHSVQIMLCVFSTWGLLCCTHHTSRGLLCNINSDISLGMWDDGSTFASRN